MGRTPAGDSTEEESQVVLLGQLFGWAGVVAEFHQELEIVGGV